MSSPQANMTISTLNKDNHFAPQEPPDAVPALPPVLADENGSLAHAVTVIKAASGSDTETSTPADKDAVVYPSGATLGVIVLALALSVFLSALDIVSTRPR